MPHKEIENALDVDALVRLWGSDTTIPAESDDTDEREVKVLGASYGELAERLWKEIVEQRATG